VPEAAADGTSVVTAGMKEQLMQDFAIAAESSEASDTEDTEAHRTGQSM
jgi:hypothetical protein